MDCHACHAEVEGGGVEVQATYRLADLSQIDRVIICEGCFHDGAGADIGKHFMKEYYRNESTLSSLRHPPLQRGVY